MKSHKGVTRCGPGCMLPDALCGLDKMKPGMVVVCRVALMHTVQAVRLHDMLLLAMLEWHGSHIEVHQAAKCHFKAMMHEPAFSVLV